MTQNLFQSLFKYQPGEAITPAENFLTESFAYVLRANPKLAILWAKEIAKRRHATWTFDRCDVKTQVPYKMGSTLYPDMVIYCLSAAGQETHVIISEHKWKSGTNWRQLQDYRALVADYGENACVVFIADTFDKRAKAIGVADVPLLWQDVYCFLQPYASEDRIVGEFVEFMRAQGLGPSEPLSLGTIAAYTMGRSVPAACDRLLDALAKKAWDFLPESLRGKWTPDQRWGRSVISLGVPGTPFWLNAGFLLDGTNHRVELCAPERGIDLVFLVDGAQDKKIRGDALFTRADAIRQEFANTRVTDQNQALNKWRKLIIQQSLADVICGCDTEEKQVEAIYKQFEEWCKVLFSDGTLEKALFSLLSPASETASSAG